jgi:glycosyltransferase involved in cell wall biosynthesis
MALSCAANTAWDRTDWSSDDEAIRPNVTPGRCVVSPGQRHRPKLCFLMAHVDGPGGAARSVINLANHLVDRYDVQIIGVLRQRKELIYAVDPRITVEYAADLRPFGPDGERRSLSEGGVDSSGRPVTRRMVFDRESPSVIAPFAAVHWESTDQPLIDAIQRSDADVMIGTRPSLNRFVAEFAKPGVLKVGQDHMNLSIRLESPGRDYLAETIPHLDVLVLLTAGDAHAYRSTFPDVTTSITAIPNGLSWPVAERAALTNKVVVAAGRLEEQKAFDRLIDAYAPVAEARPDWQLDIYGKGPQGKQLGQQIDRLGVDGQVTLRGYSTSMPDVLANASVYAMTSIFEGFPMVLLEAMSHGLPMVSYDCPTGPAELIRDGVSGRLLPDGDSEAFTAALLQLIDNPELRRRMGEAAWRDVHEYEMPRIVEQWEKVFAR